MATWRVFFARGWRDQAPLSVRDFFGRYEGHECAAAFDVLADSHLEGTPGVTLAFHTLGFFLAMLNASKADVVSWVFVNFKPEMHSLSPRPESVGRTEVPSIGEGLRLFAAW